jgi:hypothetical protein
MLFINILVNNLFKMNFLQYLTVLKTAQIFPFLTPLLSCYKKLFLDSFRNFKNFEADRADKSKMEERPFMKIIVIIKLLNSLYPTIRIQLKFTARGSQNQFFTGRKLNTTVRCTIYVAFLT